MLRYLLTTFVVLIVMAALMMTSAAKDVDIEIIEEKRQEERENTEPMMFVDNTGELVDLKEMEF